MRSRPETSKRGWSIAQKEHLSRFEKAKEYARKAISDPVLNEIYAKKAARKHGLGAWHLAISDYCHPAEINSVNFSDCRGKTGDEIIITVFDKYEVTGMKIVITSPVGMLLEEGAAKRPLFDFRWKYTLKSEIELVPDLKITISVTDLPGNITSENLVFPFEYNKEMLFPGTHIPGASVKRRKSQLRIRATNFEQTP
jgi:hypothetical protein